MDSRNMDAIVLKGIGNLQLEKRDVPVPKKGQALVKTLYAGICGSDIHAYHGHQPSFRFPSVLGHELVGEVVEIKGVSDLKAGQRVIVDPSIRCNNCSTCLAGKENICENLKVMGVHIDGGFSHYFVCNVEQLYAVDADISNELAILAEPLSIAAHAFDRLENRSYENIVIIGAGPIGLSLLMWGRKLSHKIAVIEILENRKKAAMDLGADIVIDGSLPIEEIKNTLNRSFGSGPDVIMDAVSNKQSVEVSSQMIKRGGDIVVVGMADGITAYSLLTILKKELTIFGTRMTKGRFPSITEFLSKQDEAYHKPFVTNIFPYTSYEEAFQMAEEHPEEAIKIVLSFIEQQN